VSEEKAMRIKTEEGSFSIDFEPSRYKTPAGAAKALYRSLIKLNMKWGVPEESAKKEVLLLSPERSSSLGYGRLWRVMWESGPYEWAVWASFAIHSDGWYTEPYYSFDLGFVPN
jgi:hypothetical protein